MKSFSRLAWAVPLYICATLAQAEAPLGIQGLVTVKNDENNPVPVTGELTVDSTTPVFIRGEVSLPPPDAFVGSLTASIQGGGTNASSRVDFDIPAGSIAVVENVSAQCTTPPGNRIFSIRLLTRDALTSGGTALRLLTHLSLNLQGKPDFSDYEYYASAGPVTAYAGVCDDCLSTSIFMDIGRERASPLTSQCDVTFHGHFVTP